MINLIRRPAGLAAGIIIGAGLAVTFKAIGWPSTELANTSSGTFAAAFTIPYQGNLLVDGQRLNAIRGVRVGVFTGAPSAQATTSTAAYTETHGAVSVNQGRFAIEIGTGVPSVTNATLDSKATPGKPLFLKLAVQDASGAWLELGGAQQIQGVPFAYSSRAADKLEVANGAILRGPANNSATGAAPLRIEDGNGEKLVMDGNAIEATEGTLHLNYWNKHDVIAYGHFSARGNTTLGGASTYTTTVSGLLTASAGARVTGTAITGAAIGGAVVVADSNGSGPMRLDGNRIEVEGERLLLNYYNKTGVEINGPTIASDSRGVLTIKDGNYSMHIDGDDINAPSGLELQSWSKAKTRVHGSLEVKGDLFIKTRDFNVNAGGNLVPEAYQVNAVSGDLCNVGEILIGRSNDQGDSLCFCQQYDGASRLTNRRFVCINP